MDYESIILIVDDESFGREVLNGLLFNQGYTLAFAAGGAEALAQAARLIPDLILLDVMMPDMDGFETCRRLRADPVLAEVPIIMVTALDDRESRLAGIEAGADDFVSKPFDRTELRTRVQTITRLNRFRRLQVERSKFEWVIEQSDDGYVVVDEADRLTYANRQARLYLNLSPEPEPLPSISFWQLAGQQYSGQPQDAWEGWPNQVIHQSPRYLVKTETAATNTFWLQVEVLALQSNASRIIRLRNVTTQMAIQRDMWKFHSFISHKLRTPLIPMLSGLELAVSWPDELRKEEIVTLARRAFTSAKRLSDSVNDIINYMSAPNLSKTGGSLSLAELQTTMVEISADLQLPAITIGGSGFAGRDGLKLTMSRQAIELILREIFENAKKFHPQKTPQIVVSAGASAPDVISLQVADDGLTLTPEQLAQVWTPYYQGEKYFTGEAAGMGLGLSMVASMVWGVGGTCHMRNRSGGPGVVVELNLPVISA